MGQVGKRATLEYAYLVSGVRQEWNEHVCQDCAILHKGPYEGWVGNLIASASMLFSLQFYGFMDYV